MNEGTSETVGFRAGPRADGACGNLFLVLGMATLAVAVLGPVALAGAQGGDASRDANAFVREIVANELKAQKEDNSFWRYLQTEEQHGKTTVREVVETKMCEVHRDLSVDGQPLTGARAEKEKARIEKLINDPSALHEKHASEEKDVENEQKLLRMLPEAFRYSFAGQDGALTKLDFTPNPAFHASGHEGEVFHHMSGSIWVDARQKRVARVRGVITSDVRFGGFLGHLDKGGVFDVEQQDVGDGFWELTRLDVHMRGRMLLFKGIDVQQSQRDTEFVRVPADLSMQQVAQMLEKASPPSANVSAQTK